MKLHTMGFCVGEAMQNLWRNPVLSIASVTTGAISLLVFGIFLILGQNIGHVGSVIESQVTVRVFINASADTSQVQTLGADIRGTAGVRAVSFESKGSALYQLKQEFGTSGSLLNSLGPDNPLLSSYIVHASSPKDVAKVAASMQRMAYVSHVSYQAGVVARLFKLINYIRIGGLALGILLAIGALLVIQNAIRVGLFARRREISIMRLVGGTESLVRLPFVLEGLMLGLIGSLMAAAVLVIGYGMLYAQLRQGLPFLPVLAPITLERQFGLLLVGLGALIGVVGSRMSLRRLQRAV